jgi:CubicO group peptidase (beta-lactamase class C family)
MPNDPQNIQPNNPDRNKLMFLAATLGVLIVTVSICSGAAPTQDAAEAVWPTNAWQTSSPEEQGMDSSELASLVEFGEPDASSGSGTLAGGEMFDSVLVARHGKIVLEVYYAPYAADIPHNLHSVTKSVMSTLFAIAARQGLLDSPSHRVIDYFDHRNIANLDERKESITIQNLLDMTSGIEWQEHNCLDEDVTMVEMEHSPNWVDFFLDRPMTAVPGTMFNYDTGGPHLLSAVLTRLTGMSAEEYGRENLFSPLGIDRLYWKKDPQGISTGGDGLFLMTRDMAKIGYLYLKNGAWEGRQIVPVQSIDKIRNASINTPDGLLYSNLFWSLPDRSAFMALGHHGQTIMIFPALDTVAVTTAHAPSIRVVPVANMIRSSVKSDTTISPDPSAMKLLTDKIKDASTEKPTEVGRVPNTAALISGKVYRFPRNKLNLKSLSLVLSDPQPRYNVELYAEDSANGVNSTLSGPIGLNGLYQKGKPTNFGISAVKGTWQDQQTFVIEVLRIGAGNPPRRYALTENLGSSRSPLSMCLVTLCCRNGYVQ